MADFEVMTFTDAGAWQAWLETEHATCDGIWLQLAKKGSGIASVTAREAVDIALRFGWIDGQARSVDERHYRIKFTPRRVRSMWSQVNRKRAEELIEAGLMRPAGLAEVERARADGRWDAAYPPPSTAEVPPDLAAALAATPAAAAFFATLSSQNRYAILHRLHQAKRPDTRARRIATFVAQLADHETLH